MENKMYTATLDEYKTKQDELFRQAEKYRLIQTIDKTNSPVSRLINTLRITINQLFLI